ncbi:orotate phosphoribosyltransferase [Buchnera aphidicola]|uniref:Orotate phosphoribosyltransferase n=1 Tax=Buchnera aphidicola (Stegophylla sp.) TaxID=2315800 RepID=A0A4D6YAR3_9GAMM|nr:orotate phosphoribosyltransferase [Buchnera aphidicola (Stegophylla sp.)]QCI26509.1 orotate phosphoribosyltransferase [Buchnera aphidicola (Stegophylla sp.)]
MREWKKKFIEFSLHNKILTFGKFQLKSGRNSPYFFNSKYFYTGLNILKLGKFYAHAIVHSKINPDMLFGLAYKGIPIVVATAIALKIYYNINLPYCFNRKEFKNYGDQGIIIGPNINHNNIIIIDDVLTSGITIQKYINTKPNNSIYSIFVAFNRQEYGISNVYSATEEIKNNHPYCKIFSIINIFDLIKYLIKYNKYPKKLKKIITYQNIYGCKKYII